jgi:hypothetical protein
VLCCVRGDTLEDIKPAPEPTGEGIESNEVLAVKPAIDDGGGGDDDDDDDDEKVAVLEEA